MSNREEMHALVIRAQNQDQQAMALLIEKNQERLFRFLVLQCRNPELARDICQETFIRAIENLGKLTNPSGFSSWLHRIAKNLFLEHLRRPSTHSETEEVTEMEAGPEADPGAAFEVQKALGQLKEDDRMILLLVDLEGHSYGEAAEIMGISENALRSRLHRARKAFVEIVDGEKN